MLAAATGVNMTMGLNYSWSIFQKHMVFAWGWTNLAASLPYTVYAVVIALLTIIGGWAQDKFGPRPVATAGSILIGIGLVLSSFSRTPAMMMVTYGILTATGYGLCYSTTIPAVVKAFPPERKGMVTGIVLSGIGIATIYVSLVANWTIGEFGLPQTFLILGGVAFTVDVCLAQLLQAPAGIGRHAPPADAAGRPGVDLGWREMVRTAVFYRLWLMFFFAVSAGTMIIGHVATIAKVQADWEDGFYLVVLLAIFNIFGRLSAGLLADKFGLINVLRATIILQTVNIACFAAYTAPLPLAAGTAITGLCYGAAFSLFPKFRTRNP